MSRIQGMSRLTASSMIAAVDGPNAVRWASRRKTLELRVEVEAVLGPHEVVHQPHGEPPAASPTVSSMKPKMTL